MGKIAEYWMSANASCEEHESYLFFGGMSGFYRAAISIYVYIPIHNYIYTLLHDAYIITFGIIYLILVYYDYIMHVACIYI